jgi:hypothetical protein
MVQKLDSGSEFTKRIFFLNHVFLIISIIESARFEPLTFKLSVTVSQANHDPSHHSINGLIPLIHTSMPVTQSRD